MFEQFASDVESGEIPDDFGYIDNLADTRFSSQEELNSFLEGYSQPEELFYSLLNDYPKVYKNFYILI